MITSTYDKCKYCNSNTILTDYSAGQIACSTCGVVLEERIIDETSEWRKFNSDNPGSSHADPNRVGGPINPLLDGSNDLSIVIKTKDNNGSLGKWSNRSFQGGNRSMQRGASRLKELAEKLGLQECIVNKSVFSLLKVEQSKKLKGRSLDSALAVIFYYSCREENVPRPLNEIITKLELNQREVKRTYHALMAIINMPDDIQKRNTEHTKGYVQKFCTSLDIDQQFIKMAKDIAETICREELEVGRKPNTIAGVAIFIASKLKNLDYPTRKDISTASLISENTINLVYQGLAAKLDQIIPQEYKSLIKNTEN